MSRIDQFILSSMAGAMLDSTSKERLLLVAALVAATEQNMGHATRKTPEDAAPFSACLRSTTENVQKSDDLHSSLWNAHAPNPKTTENVQKSDDLHSVMVDALDSRDKVVEELNIVAKSLGDAGFANVSPEDKNPVTNKIEPLDPRPWPERAASFIENLARRAEPGPVDNRFVELITTLTRLGVAVIQAPGEEPYVAVKLNLEQSDLTPLEQVRQRLLDAEARAQEPRISKETLDRLNAAATGWRLPKRGDRVRLLEAVPGVPWLVAGDVYEVQREGIYYPIMTDDERTADPLLWMKKAEFAVHLFGLEQEQRVAVPLRLLEPVADAAPGPDDDRAQNRD